MDSRNKELFEIKDDEEQKSKLQDICDLLLAAGYFRVRLRGISAFDKVVGGIVWCLEMSAIDVDVNFLFRENLNIGEKIEITEKIIRVLISINCAYTLEPHQIQGLDTVKIYPVVQWLVKKAMETRELFSDHFKAIASLQYEKHFQTSSPNDRCSTVEATRNIQYALLPQRKFKKISKSNTCSENQQVAATLMEYGVFSTYIADTGESSLQTNQESTRLAVGSKKVEQRSVALCVSNLINQQTGTISKAIEDYAHRKTEREVEKDKLLLLQDELKSVSEALNQTSSKIERQKHEMELLKEREKELDSTIEALDVKRAALSSSETDTSKPLISELDDLVHQNELVSLQRKEFKNQCKIRMEEMKRRNENLARKYEVTPAEDVDKTKNKLRTVTEQLNNAKKLLGEKNVTSMKLLRQLDAIPGNSELNQYQRRFTELCTQVNEKQTELNGYYLLYNTLQDTKVYLNKELSLLTSIHDSFTQSMMSSSAKIEFLHQMENIVSAVRHNRNKLEKQIQSKKDEYDDLKKSISDFAREEQLYRETLKLIAQESQKYKVLLAKSNQLVQS